MNDLYFACTDCKSYVDCGYRWAYRTLEQEGVVERRGRIHVRRVLGASKYWNPPREPRSSWLFDEVLPSVRAFLADHGEHSLVFWDINDLPDDRLLNWLQVGHAPAPSARYLAEVVRLRAWSDVLEWFKSSPRGQPWGSR
jgi:hypothetical protein